MSPIPPDPNSNNFSNRIRTHIKLAESWGTPHDANPCVWAMDNELLFLESVSPVGPLGQSPISAEGMAVQSFMTSRGITPKYTSSLFSGLSKAPGVEDVHLVQLSGQVKLFELLDDLRAHPLAAATTSVSPNHVLIPASNGDGCPYGPPAEYKGTVPPPIPGDAEPPDGFSPSFTLIDSGYQWDAKKWGKNPLDALVGRVQPPPIPALWHDGTRWEKTPAEIPDADQNHRLDALAGHANFVAGVLAQRTRKPTITIWNHNASFVGKDERHIPTELTVLHSLVRSQQEGPASPVIVVVFAFPAYDGLLGEHWGHALKQLHHDNPNFVLVAPTGNQDDTTRRYPAALAKADPNAPPGTFLADDHPEVIGVGSLNPDGDSRSTFSNYGTESDEWVTCSAVGENVVSTFLHVDMEPEEDPWPPGTPAGGHDFAQNSWATWQGTCFATPKVAAAIANFLPEAHDDASEAWKMVIDRFSSGVETGLGYRMDRL